MTYNRRLGRAPDALRDIQFLPNFTKWAEGSVLVSFGDTRVLCTASIEERIPGWMKEQRNGNGWITAEYAMLPRATDKRNQRESVQGKIGGRTHEISRLIGRALRTVVDMKKLGERTITLDCDVIQADGGTRTAAITGSYVALKLATDKLVTDRKIDRSPMKQAVAAVSIGIVEGEVMLDLDFSEDQKADTDLNLVMTSDGGIVEVQGTAEKKPFTKMELAQMLELGASGIQALFEAQKAVLVR